MATERKPDAKRGDMAFILAIILGLAVGLLIKRVRLGILLGLIIGGAIVALGWLRSTRK
jgi:divalent metal cation (Fe/Co/Zn/Cd) transporter